MPLLHTRHFGSINLEQPNEWYESEITLNGINIEIVITIPTGAKTPDPESVQAIDDYLDNLVTHEESIRQFIHRDFREKGETDTYLELQLEYLEEDDLETLISGIEGKRTKKQKLLSILHPITLVFYPEEADTMFAILDYTIGTDLTDHLLAIKIHKDNHISIDIES